MGILKFPMFFHKLIHHPKIPQPTPAFVLQSKGREIPPATTPALNGKVPSPMFTAALPKCLLLFSLFFKYLPRLSRVGQTWTHWFLRHRIPSSAHPPPHCHAEHNFHLLLKIQYWELLIPKILIFQYKSENEPQQDCGRNVANELVT